MAIRSCLAVLVLAASLGVAAEAAAQSRPTIGPPAPPRPSPRPPVAPLSEAQVEASVSRAIGRLDASVTGAPITLSVRQPYHAATGASLGFSNANHVLPEINEAMLFSRGAGGTAILNLPNTFTGEIVIDCEVADTVAVRWYGDAQEGYEVGTMSNHVLFVVPASAGPRIYIYSVRESSWTLQGCRIQRVV